MISKGAQPQWLRTLFKYTQDVSVYRRTKKTVRGEMSQTRRIILPKMPIKRFFHFNREVFEPYILIKGLLLQS